MTTMNFAKRARNDDKWTILLAQNIKQTFFIDALNALDSRKAGGMNIMPEQLQREFCEIFCVNSGFFGGKSYFEAKGVGRSGNFSAGRSRTVFQSSFLPGKEEPLPDIGDDKNRKKAEHALNELLSHLRSEGWQRYGKRTTLWWWDYKFRR